ncbi:MAG: YncE family protein [Bacteroidota bacterium]|nr:YncE family protein [Bacteroidota bacterium]MDE2644269.1 YncE family protein [Bacteroidota bacterium]
MLRKYFSGVTFFLVLVHGNVLAQSVPTVFSRDVLPIIQEKFVPLLERETGLSLESWDGIMAGSDHGELVVPYDPDGSLLIRLATDLSDEDSLSVHAAELSDEDILTVRSWIERGAPNDEGHIAYSDASNLLYACVQGAAKVAVIDMDANVVIRTIDLQELGFTENSRPHHVAVEPDGSAFYVSLIGDDAVLKFNRNNELIDQIAFERPGMLVVSPTDSLLFVGRSMKAVNPPQRIGIVERNGMEIEELDVFFSRPHALATNPTGMFVYVASLAQNDMAVVNVATEQIFLRRLQGDPHTLVQFAVSPDGRSLVVGGQLTGEFLFFDLSADPFMPVPDGSIKVGMAPWHPVFSPDGNYVWFGNKMGNRATVVDVAERAVAATVEGLAEPHGAAISPNGRNVYISNNNLKGAYSGRYSWQDGHLPGVIAVIDSESREITKMLEVGPNPTGLGTR